MYRINISETYSVIRRGLFWVAMTFNLIVRICLRNILGQTSTI